MLGIVLVGQVRAGEMGVQVVVVVGGRGEAVVKVVRVAEARRNSLFMVFFTGLEGHAMNKGEKSEIRQVL